jgi:SNF2 family DNA or RNA helicase
VRIPEQVRGADVVVTSYTLFRLDFEAYQDLDGPGLILDEAQFVKNRTSKVHQAAKDFDRPLQARDHRHPDGKQPDGAVGRCSTSWLPACSRRPADSPRTTARRSRRSGQPAAGRLRRRIRPLMMRRTKEAVASDLPPKQEQVLEVELTPEHRHIYETYLQRERQKLLGLIEDMNSNRMIVFRSLTLLRMLSLDASLVDPEHEGVRRPSSSCSLNSSRTCWRRATVPWSSASSPPT